MLRLHSSYEIGKHVGSYSSSLTSAVFAFPFVAAIFTMPFMVYKYRKLGSVPWTHVLIVYSFVFYLLCAYFLVLLPLPADHAAIVPGAKTPQLIPFDFVRKFLSETTSSITQPSTWVSVFTDPNIYGAFFNVLLLTPLGMYLRYYFRRPWWQVLLIGFLVSLSFETTQLTGDWGLYEHPYRLFDVDDLMTNTLGAMVGYWLAGPLLKILPDLDRVKQAATQRGYNASLTRRALSFAIDFTLSQMLAAVLLVAIAIFIPETMLIEAETLTGAGHALFWGCGIAGLLLVYVVFPLATHRQTPGQKMLKLRIVSPDGGEAKWYQVALRYPLLFAMLLLPPWAFSSLILLGTEALDPATGDVSTEASGVAAAIAQNPDIVFDLLAVATTTWLVTIAVRGIKSARGIKPFVMLNGLVSFTRVMTLKGIAEIDAYHEALRGEDEKTPTPAAKTDA